MKYIVTVTVDQVGGSHEHREFEVYRESGKVINEDLAVDFLRELLHSQVAVPEATTVASVSFNVVEVPEEKDV